MTREELLQQLDGIVAKKPKSDWAIYQRKIVDEAIKALQQEPRKGKWLAIRTKDGKHEMTCSCCGYVRVELINRSFTEETALEHLKDRIDENKFCPNCGADMRGEK